jgi:Tfp pilus assembly protein PilF
MEERPDGDPNTYIAARTELAGFKFFRGNKEAEDDFQAALSFCSQPSEQAHVRREMAWWMYRAGKFQAAAEQLGAARQVFPELPETTLLLVWVLSDIGRQADAEQMLSGAMLRERDSGEQHAARAVLEWRTEDKESAKNQFREAAQIAPEWMSPHWVENNYSAAVSEAALKLQAIETARRIKELQERQRASAGQQATAQ